MDGTDGMQVTFCGTGRVWGEILLKKKKKAKAVKARWSLEGQRGFAECTPATMLPVVEEGKPFALNESWQEQKLKAQWEEEGWRKPLACQAETASDSSSFSVVSFCSLPKMHQVNVFLMCASLSPPLQLFVAWQKVKLCLSLA